MSLFDQTDEELKAERAYRDSVLKKAEEQTPLTIEGFLKELMNYDKHTYSTIVHAVAAAGIGAMNAVNRHENGHITGFQAGCVMWEVIDKWGQFGEGPKRMQSFQNMLYPQYASKFNSISPDTWEWVKQKATDEITKVRDAREKIEAGADPQSVHIAHPNVVAHWESIASGTIPFGLQVKED